MNNLIAIISKPDNIPIILLLILVPLCTWTAFKTAFDNDKAIAAGKTPWQAVMKGEADLPEKLHVWPYLLRIELLAAILCFIFLIVWSTVFNAPLESPANANLTPNPSKAPWYFLGLQELLVYFDPWIAGVVLPNIILVGLMAIPYIDVNPKGNGYYTWRERKFAISMFCLGFLVMWVALIIIGTFIRGPGWMWFWPWQHWDSTKVVAEVNRDLPDLLTGGRFLSTSLEGSIIGGGFLAVYFLLGLVVPYVVMKMNKSEILEKLGPERYVATSLLFWSMMFVILKIILRLTLSVKYIWVTPFFNV